MQTFRHEHVFFAPTLDAIFASYFDPSCSVAQDKEVDIVERTVSEESTANDVYHRVCRVVPKRQLPSFIRPLVSGPLHYTEDLHWYKRENRMTFVIRPSLMSGRAQINADYRLFDAGDAPGGWRTIRRVYEGNLTIDVPLVGGRIEKGIVADMETSLKITAASTQAWINANYPRGSV